MGFLTRFGRRSPEAAEKKGDALLEAGEYGLAKMEYEDGLQRWRKAASADGTLKARLEEKLRETKETLALKHKREGLEIMESEYDEAAAEFFRLALELTENPELIQELQGLIDKMRHRSGVEDATAPYDPRFSRQGEAEEIEPMVEDDEVFEALCSSLPAPIRREFHQSGEAFKEGYIALNQGRFEVAGEKLLQAMNENPEAEFIALELAAAYLNLERHEEARGLVEGFLGSHPDSLQGYQVLCETLWAMEEFEAALERLKGCPVTLAESVPLIILRGETLMHAGRLEEAEQLYENELGSRGWQSDIARSLGGCYEARGKIEQARDIFGKLLTECRTCGSASDPYVKQRFSELSFELGDYSSSVLEHYLSLVREDPSGRADYYEKISRIYALQGNDEEAERFEGFAQRARRDLLASETGP